jgi:hypothetical protein
VYDDLATIYTDHADKLVDTKLNPSVVDSEFVKNFTDEWKIYASTVYKTITMCKYLVISSLVLGRYRADERWRMLYFARRNRRDLGYSL